MSPIARAIPIAIAVAAAAAIVTAASPARGEGRRVLVFPIAGVDGDAGPRLTRVVARAAGLTGADVIVGATTFEDAAALAGCARIDAACRAQVAEALQVDEIVIGRLDGDTLELRLYRDGGETIHAFALRGTVEERVTQLAREAPGAFVGPPAASPPEPTRAHDPPPRDDPPRGKRRASAPRPPPSPPREPRARIATASWIVAGSGLVATGVGLAFWARARSIEDDVRAAPVATRDDFDRLIALEDEGRRATTIGNVLVVGGGAVAIAGGVWILAQALSRGDDGARAVAWKPIALPGGAALSLELVFP